MIGIYERHKSKHSVNYSSASPERKISNQSKTGTPSLNFLFNPLEPKIRQRRIIIEASNQKKLSPKMDLRNMKTVSDFKHYSRHHVPTLPEHKNHIQNFKKKVGIVIETLSSNSKNPYKILQSLVSNFTPFYQNIPGNNNQRVNLPIKIEDGEGNMRDLSVKINTQNLERHLLQKYSNRLLQNQYDSSNIIKKMTKEYQELLNKLVNKSLVIRIPREFKVSLDDFNDYYTLKSQQELEAEEEAKLKKEKEHKEKEEAQKTVEQELMTMIEEQVNNEVTETLIIPSENQMTEGEEDTMTDDNRQSNTMTNTMERITTEEQIENPIRERAMTERVTTEHDLHPIEEEYKPQFSQRTYYEEEEDEEEFQRRQEEKRKKKNGGKYNQVIHQASAPTAQPIERNASDATDDMRRNIQEYIEKLDHDIEEQERLHPNDPKMSREQSTQHSTSRMSQQYSTNSGPNGYLRHMSTRDTASGQPDSYYGRVPTSTPDTFEYKAHSASISRQQNLSSVSPNTDMLIINSAYDTQKDGTTSGADTGTNKSKKHNNLHSSSTIRERSPRRERGSQGHTDGRGSTDGKNSTDGRSDNESQGGKFRKTKRSSQKFGDTRSIGTSASEHRAKAIEYEKYDRATLIQMLLEAPSILDSDIKIKDHGEAVVIPTEFKFENEKSKSLFTKIYTWHHNLNSELRLQEAEWHLEHFGSSESEETESDDEL
jgi:hypothetical protein